MRQITKTALKAMAEARGRGEDIHAAAEAVVPCGAMTDVIVELVRAGILPPKCVARNGAGDVQIAYAMELTAYGKSVAETL